MCRWSPVSTVQRGLSWHRHLLPGIGSSSEPGELEEVPREPGNGWVPCLIKGLNCCMIELHAMTRTPTHVLAPVLLFFCGASAPAQNNPQLPQYHLWLVGKLHLLHAGISSSMPCKDWGSETSTDDEKFWLEGTCHKLPGL